MNRLACIAVALLCAFTVHAQEPARTDAERAELAELTRVIAELQKDPGKVAAPVVVQVPNVDIERRLAAADAWEKLILKWIGVAGVVVAALSTFIFTAHSKLKEFKERQARQSARIEGLQTQVTSIALATPGTGTGNGAATEGGK